MKKILVHTCCGPCSIMPVNTLIKSNFSPTAYFFNPNIHLQEEYLLRLFAMKEVATYYDIPLIIAGNHDYSTSIMEEIEKSCQANYANQINQPNQADQMSLTSFDQRAKYKIAIAECTEFLSLHMSV